MVVKGETGQVIVSNLKVTNTFFTRLKGLLGTKELREGDGLLIKPCNGIHMFWMKYSIDVVFLDKEYRVVHLIKGIKPWRVSPVIKEATMVLELPTGTIDRSNIKHGETIHIS
jgi:uncharacterized membrane protein (UPF0127 family)